MNNKERREFATEALKVAIRALHTLMVCRGAVCYECPYYTDRGRCIYYDLRQQLDKARKEQSNE